MNAFMSSPFVIPVAGILLGLVLGLAGIFREIKQRQLRADQRMAMLARGMPVDEINKMLGHAEEADRPARDPLRAMANARRAALVLLSVGLGVAAFGLMLAAIVHQREVLVVPATGVIPVAIGLGFLIDYRMQARELARFGLEVDADSTAHNLGRQI